VVVPSPAARRRVWPTNRRGALTRIVSRPGTDVPGYLAHASRALPQRRIGPIDASRRVAPRSRRRCQLCERLNLLEAQAKADEIHFRLDVSFVELPFASRLPSSRTSTDMPALT
jgi:hypothetical protein